MKKNQKRFICQSCGTEYSRWAGKCDTCENWNTIQEESTERFSKPLISRSAYSPPIPLKDANFKNHARISTGFEELDLVFGGGIVPGSISIIGGEPGVGKSTLILSIAKKISDKTKILYISGEESSAQIRMRAGRMKVSGDNIFLSSETIAEKIVDMVRGENPNLVFIDSIQTISRESLFNQAGTVTQLRECTQLFLELSKSTGVPILLIGHITKEGSIAGPKVLEHLVDVVLYFESDKLNYYRLVRGIKNRFGPVGDTAVFEIYSEGLREVLNKHDLFISKDHENRTGTVLSAILEGSRSLTVEVQALVSRTAYSQARRMSEGIDNRRLILMGAVIEKFLGIKLVECDIFSNLAGGLSIDEPALDLAICISIISSFREQKVATSLAVLGEVGLSGEVRPVSNIVARLKELNSLGIRKIIIPDGNLKELSGLDFQGITPISHIREFETAFSETRGV